MNISNVKIYKNKILKIQVQTQLVNIRIIMLDVHNTFKYIYYLCMWIYFFTYTNPTVIATSNIYIT